MICNHPIGKNDIKYKATCQQALDEFVKGLFPSKSDFQNWPPKIPTSDEVRVKSASFKKWLEEISDGDELFWYSNITGCLSGSAGWVHFKNGVQISTFVIMKS